MKACYSEDAHSCSSKGVKRSLWRWTPGIADEFIQPLGQALIDHPNRPLILFCRVSTEQQEQKGDLQAQVHDCVHAIKEFGRTVLHVVSGQETSDITGDRPFLERAIQLAKEHDGLLVAQARDRILRRSGFKELWRLNAQRDKPQPDSLLEQPSVGEYMQFRMMAAGIPVATIYPPNYTPQSERSKRGQAAGRKGGRPQKKKSVTERRKEYLALASRLYEQHASYRKTADELNRRMEPCYEPVTWKTVHNWVNKCVIF